LKIAFSLTIFLLYPPPQHSNQTQDYFNYRQMAARNKENGT